MKVKSADKIPSASERAKCLPDDVYYNGRFYHRPRFTRKEDLFWLGWLYDHGIIKDVEGGVDELAGYGKLEFVGSLGDAMKQAEMNCVHLGVCGHEDCCNEYYYDEDKEMIWCRDELTDSYEDYDDIVIDLADIEYMYDYEYGEDKDDGEYLMEFDLNDPLLSHLKMCAVFKLNDGGWHNIIRIVNPITGKYGEATCVHTAVCDMEIEEFNSAIKSGTFYGKVIELSRSTENEQIELEPREHFWSLCSYVEGLAEVGLVPCIITEYFHTGSSFEEVNLLPIGMNALMKHNLLMCIKKADKSAYRQIINGIWMNLLKCPVEWFEPRVHLLLDAYGDDAFIYAIRSIKYKNNIDIASLSGRQYENLGHLLHFWYSD